MSCDNCSIEVEIAMRDSDKDPTGIPVPVKFGPVPVELAGTRPVPHFLWIKGFLCFALMSYLQVPWLDNVHPSSSQNVSRAPPPIRYGDTWIGKLSIFSPFVTFIYFTST